MAGLVVANVGSSRWCPLLGAVGNAAGSLLFVIFYNLFIYLVLGVHSFSSGFAVALVSHMHPERLPPSGNYFLTKARSFRSRQNP